MAKLNANGTFSDSKREVIAQGPDFTVSILLAEHNKLWRFGVSYQVGGSQSGAKGFSFVPNVAQIGYPTDQDCIKAAKSYIRDGLQQIVGANLFTYPHISKIAQKAMDSIKEPKKEQGQMSLF